MILLIILKIMLYSVIEYLICFVSPGPGSQGRNDTYMSRSKHFADRCEWSVVVQILLLIIKIQLTSINISEFTRVKSTLICVKLALIILINRCVPISWIDCTHFVKVDTFGSFDWWLIEHDCHEYTNKDQRVCSKDRLLSPAQLFLDPPKQYGDMPFCLVG